MEEFMYSMTDHDSMTSSIAVRDVKLTHELRAASAPAVSTMAPSKYPGAFWEYPADSPEANTPLALREFAKLKAMRG